VVFLLKGFFVENEIQTGLLFSKLDEEKKTGELLPLPKNFYKQIEEDLKKQTEQQTSISELQNKQTTFSALKAKRLQKILVYLAYNKNPPSQIPVEEELLYYQILKIMNKEVKAPKTTKIKILIKIPEIITTKGNKVGPYQEGETVQVEDSADIEFMINNKIGEIID
jgi:hypothetical protein